MKIKTTTVYQIVDIEAADEIMDDAYQYHAVPVSVSFDLDGEIDPMDVTMKLSHCRDCYQKYAHLLDSLDVTECRCGGELVERVVVILMIQESVVVYADWRTE
jgi:hypothetical protein